MEIHSLGRYQVRAPLGRGTMGIVYRAYDPVLDREVAVKTVELSPGLSEENRSRFLARFFQEAKIAAKLLHPNIVVTHDASTDAATGVPFIAMELVSDGSLHERMERDGAMPWREASRLVVLLARALDYAHREKVVHRDVKPANVLLTANGVPKIADFGIAKLADTHLTLTGSVVGTPFYMSPEQLEADEIDGRSDLFSLGALFYAILVGQPPFRGSDLPSIGRAVLHKSPEPPSEIVPGIPESIDGIVGRVLAKKREERYATGAELAEDLERFLRGERPLRSLSLGEKTLEAGKPRIEGVVREPEPEIAIELEPAETRPSAFRFLFWLLAAGALAYAGTTHWTSIEDTVRRHREETDRREALSVRGAALRAEAQDRLGRGAWDEASRALEESLRRSREAGDGAGEAESLVLRGLLRAETGDWSAARADLDSAASVFEIYGVPEGRARALLELANLERDLGAFDRAAKLYDEAGRSEAPLADLAFEKALLEWMRGDRASAEGIYRSLSDGAPREEDRARAAAALSHLEAGRAPYDPGEPRTRRSEERWKRLATGAP